ncbi:MAG: hypothetical protein HC819_16785 [Cyclobacteriaceae bacterium]|nr:hypothetical protein [Cyclobacteriaceae bacterium]
MYKILIISIVILSFSSCATKKNLTYLQGKPVKSAYQNANQYFLRSGDNIYVQIKSSDPTMSNIYNLHPEGDKGSINEAFIFFNSYAIDTNGMVEIPLVGNIFVSGTTLEEAGNIISAALEDHLLDATISVKLASFKISVLGEVNSPGVHLAYHNQLTIFEAIGLAGDLNEYGSRKKIKLIREYPQGLMNTYDIDLTKWDIFASEAYYVYPHDIIYVKPTTKKPLDMNLRSVGILLSAATLLLLIFRTFN